MSNKKLMFIVQAAMIAAIYVVLVFVFQFSSSGVIQVRVAEALTVLPFFTPAAIPGLAIGCLIANLLTGCAVLDIVFGTLATLIAAIGSYALRKNRYLVVLPPIIANMIIVPWVLRFAYSEAMPIWLSMITVGAGEVISCGILGTILLTVLLRYKNIFRLPA